MAGSTAMWHHVISGGYGSNMWGPSVLFFVLVLSTVDFFSRMIRPFWIMNVKKMWSSGQPNNRPPILRRVCTTQFWWRDGLRQFFTLTDEFRSNSPQEPLRVFGDSWTMICGWLDLKLVSTRQYGLDYLSISAKDTNYAIIKWTGKDGCYWWYSVNVSWIWKISAQSITMVRKWNCWLSNLWLL